MSRIGKEPISIPDAVEVQVEEKRIIIKGPKGEVAVDKLPETNVDIKDSTIVVNINGSQDPRAHAFLGTMRALLNNAVKGVTEGYTKELELVGVGYRVEKIGENLKLSVGYSHPVEVIAPDGITFDLEGNTKIKVSGFDKQKVGQVAAEIRAIRKPEPYKGKGIRYKDEIIRRKQGKAAKTAV